MKNKGGFTAVGVVVVSFLWYVFVFFFFNGWKWFCACEGKKRERESLRRCVVFCACVERDGRKSN